MTRPKRAWWLALAVAGLALASAGNVKVTALVAEGRVLTSFSSPAAFTDDANKVLQSGLLLTFAYTVELRRPSSFWLDRTLGETTVGASVTYDTLTKTYKVNKLKDNRVTWSKGTDKESDVREWMTSFDQVLLEPTEPLEPNVEYYVRVRLRTTPRPTVSIWPLWGRDDGSGRGDFTFIR